MTAITDINDYDAITNLIANYYLKGAISGKGSEMKASFDESATWYGYVGPDLVAGPVQTLFDWNDSNGAAKELVYSISKVEIVGTIANVRIELDNWTGHRFTDFLNLLKVDGEWKVVNKVFHLHV
tara:strand:+ start:78535 stop:78909 length:375 start_codon:yes stop_codon:yes gene_type:complete